jgi:hypothetical protein
MSRLVGPRGTACAFEARPRDKAHYNLVRATRIDLGAVTSTLGEREIGIANLDEEAAADRRGVARNLGWPVAQMNRP